MTCTIVRPPRIHGPGLAVLTLLLMPAAALAAKQIDGDRLLDPNRMIEIRIELAPNDWIQLSQQSRNMATAFSGLPSESPYTYFKADLWIDDLKIESVGVRKKGFFGSADTQRPSLKVKFDEYVDQDPVKGLSRLTLNNNKQDRSQTSQFLTYELFRKAGNFAPRSNWAHVTVNGQSLGVYSHVESIKKPFLKRNFKDKSGNLYEGTLTDFHPKAIGSIEVKTNEKNNDLSDITKLADLLAAEGDLDMEQLGQIIDLDSFFRHWALESLTGYWDGYCSNQNNYYLYFNPEDGRGHFIPWGADWVFSSRSPFSFGSRATTVIYAQSVLANRLYHTDGVPERYKATMKRLLDEVWNEDRMLADVDRIEKLVSPHLHQAQAQTRDATNEVRDFIRGRRAAVERALNDWPPIVPTEPRKPTYLVDVGTVSGSFSTVYGENGQEPAGQGTAELKVQVGDQQIEFDQVTVRAQPFRVPSFGGFGGGRGGGRPGGFGGRNDGNRQGGGFGGRGFGPGADRPAGEGNAAQAAPPAPVSLVFTGMRSEGQPVTVSLTIDREKFLQTSDKSINVTGSYREGRAVGGFGGFGGGPNRSVIGELRLDHSGTEAGDKIVGHINLKIAETHGGFFQQRRPGGGSPGGRFRPQGGGSEAQRPGSGQGTAQPITLQRALDTNRDGTISTSEIDKAAETLKRLDRNGDGRLTGDELQIPSSRETTRPNRGPGRNRPEFENDADSDSSDTKSSAARDLKQTPVVMTTEEDHRNMMVQPSPDVFRQGPSENIESRTFLNPPNRSNHVRAQTLTVG